LLIIDSNGNQVGEISDPNLLQGPWDLAIHSTGSQTQVFVSNVLSGTVTRIDLKTEKGTVPQVIDEVQIASGYATRTDPNALVVGPTGLAYDPKTGNLYVASTGDNAVYVIPNAATTSHDHGKGTPVIQDDPHLHGPLGLVLGPNGDLILANGDAQSPNPTDQNQLVEYTPTGQFVGELQLDPGTAGAAFGVALQDVNGQVRFAAVNDNANAVEVWTFDIPAPHKG
jgi:DNA-binding beta-propeller fold protein YncE